ncbi:MAG TPA: ABC transporter permease subunit, partial [Roseiflexaceae bacterium]|nr:ABC transporter permease subunit [Roseiflexaceae bacterium]
MAARAAPRRRDWSWRSRAFRSLVYQVVAVALIAFGVWYLAQNTLSNMAARGIQSGFGFLDQAAGFDIGESVIPYDALDPYWKAFLVGILNTLRVALVGIVLATILGTLLGVGRFSRNAIVRGLCYAYVEVFRNVPVLLQLLMWYLIFTDLLPQVNDALTVAGVVHLSKHGLSFPVPVWGTGQALAGIGALAGLAGAWVYRRWARAHFEATGHQHPMIWPPLGFVIGGALVGWLLGGAPTAWSVPKLDGFTLEGGASATPEFMGVLLGLVLYT